MVFTLFILLLVGCQNDLATNEPTQKVPTKSLINNLWFSSSEGTRAPSYVSLYIKSDTVSIVATSEEKIKTSIELLRGFDKFREYSNHYLPHMEHEILTDSQIDHLASSLDYEFSSLDRIYCYPLGNVVDVEYDAKCMMITEDDDVMMTFNPYGLHSDLDPMLWFAVK